MFTSCAVIMHDAVSVDKAAEGGLGVCFADGWDA